VERLKECKRGSGHEDDRAQRWRSDKHAFCLSAFVCQKTTHTHTHNKWLSWGNPVNKGWQGTVNMVWRKLTHHHIFWEGGNCLSQFACQLLFLSHLSWIRQACFHIARSIFVSPVICGFQKSHDRGRVKGGDLSAYLPKNNYLNEMRFPPAFVHASSHPSPLSDFLFFIFLLSPISTRGCVTRRDAYRIS